MSDLIVESNSSDAKPQPGGLRQTLEALICLAVAVILVRSFHAEGYMISTGSMAPTLPGFHKRVTCPSCGIEFAVGAATASDSDSGSDRLMRLPRHRARAFQTKSGSNGHQPIDESQAKTAVCPNCGQAAIDLNVIPRNQGDQLLVHKNAYDFVTPRRWEVVVFRNPAKTTQAYVKRIVGLPGEVVEIVSGDVAINGKIERKSFAQQKAMRIRVYDHNFEPKNDSGWQPRWQPQGESSGWKRDAQGFVAEKPKTPGSDEKSFTWVQYRHWLRAGGRHRTAVKIPSSIPPEDFENPSLFPLRFDRETHSLIHHGVLTTRARDRIAKVIDDPQFVAAIHELHRKAHVAPVNDDYGYNRVHRGYHPVPVRDLMFAARVEIRSGHGRFALEMTDGVQRFRFTLDAATRDIALTVDDDASPARSARMKGGIIDSPFNVEMSLVDRQVIVAIDGQPLFSPLLLKRVSRGASYSREPIRFGATDLNLRVDSLRIFRDVHYTEKGSDSPDRLDDHAFYVLGDNSPISADSRVWKQPGVERRLFLGKPLLVHLPSRPENLRVGGTNIQFRIPDFSRMRYIR